MVAYLELRTNEILNEEIGNIITEIFFSLRKSRSSYFNYFNSLVTLVTLIQNNNFGFFLHLCHNKLKNRK